MRSRHRALAALLALAAVVTATAGPADAADRRFAVVIGYNGSDDPALEPLRYADDDAVRTGQLLSHVAERVVVLTTLDEDSRALWADARPAGPPTRAALTGALDELRVAIASARASGDRPVLWFVYSGHGDYDAEGRGYVHLADGRFTTRDLFAHLIVPSGQDPVVLLVDACNASYLVHSRGPRPERRPSGPTTLRLEDYPNVGVVLASSAVGETHEWGRYLAGIFSHEVRSGLLGAADADGDLRVTFPELAAFVEAANARVTNPSVRIRPYVRPPLTDPSLALVDLDDARFPARVRIGAAVDGKAHLVDADLVRVADFHKPGPDSFWLALPHDGPFVLIHEETEHLIPAGARGELDLDELPAQARTVVSARGAGSAYFDRTLFHEPYSRELAARYLADGYLQSLELSRAVERPWYDNPGAWAVLGGGLAAGAAGAGLWAAALDSQQAAHRADYARDADRHNGRMRAFETGAWSAFAIGGAAVVGGALWLALDRPVDVETWRAPLEVGLGPGGVSVTLRR